jgi:hypothetical protein
MPEMLKNISWGSMRIKVVVKQKRISPPPSVLMISNTLQRSGTPSEDRN